MKVKELISKLCELNEEKKIIMSSDNEGNSFHEIECVGEGDKGYIIFPEH